MFSSGLTEASSGEILIRGVNPKAFSAVLLYLYSGRFGVAASAYNTSSDSTDTSEGGAFAIPSDSADSDAGPGIVLSGEDAVDTFALAHEYLLEALADAM